MMAFFGWAKHPMVNRITDLDERIPLTMIHGAESWMDNKIGYRVKQLRKNSSVDVKVIKDGLLAQIHCRQFGSIEKLTLCNS